MSTPSVGIRCHGCQYQGTIQYRPLTLKYKLPDGSTVDSHRVFGWCNDCDSPINIEEKLSREKLLQEFSRLTPLSKSIGGLFKNAIDRALGGRLDENKEERQRVLGLLRVTELRNSPQRCLTCGGINVKPLEFDDEGNSKNFVHKCGKHLYRLPVSPDGPRFSYKPEVIFLDVNGRKIGNTSSSSLNESPNSREKNYSNSHRNRSTYNGAVDALLNREYGIQTKDNQRFPGILKYLEMIDASWKSEANENECAMQIATLYLCGLFRQKHMEEIRPLALKLDNIGPQGVERGLIRQEIWDNCVALVERTQRETSSKN